MERTLVFVKPDGLHRRLVGRILQRFEEKGLHLVGLKLARLSEDLIREHYAEHRGKPFYELLVRFVLSGPVVLMVLEGPEAASVVRSLVGATSGAKASPGTIRGDFGVSQRFNLVHASDGPASAEREVAHFFAPDELVSWRPSDMDWLDETAGKEPNS
ncbi:MAG: nucleoside-diphosphate kinase [Planctomycetes bacterium]|nr:nucleoside-diphosphate kinase [Planctomycetota bacterium]